MMAQFLVIDVGNTSTKVGLVGSKGIVREVEMLTANILRSKSKLPFVKQAEGAIIASVVPHALLPLRRLLKKAGVSHPIVVSSKLDLGIGIRYPNPKSIGADRLVNAVAAAALYRTPAIVVDFGTAVTFDVISARGDYLGGVIAPGVRVLTNYLHDHTALLPHISLSEPRRAIGKSTVEAMRAGAVIGYRGLIRTILSSVKRELEGKTRKKVHIIATGGHSSLIASGIAEIEKIDPHLTLKGLALLYRRLSSKKNGWQRGK